jgi:ATP-dependent DNA helicase RecQ
MTSPAVDILRRVFGYASFRGQQAEIVDQVVRGGDALVLMPTGGGKSLCYQIPALVRPGVGVVVSPLIALMQDQVDALRLAGVRAAFLNSTLDFQSLVDTERRLLRGELDLIYVAPERLLTDRFIGLLEQLVGRQQLALFAIDEAHCVSQWGHDFRPEYIQLSQLHERFPSVPRIALTATADQLTRQEIITRLSLAEARLFVASFDRPNIRYTVVERDNPRKQLLSFLSAHGGKPESFIACHAARSMKQRCG